MNAPKMTLSTGSATQRRWNCLYDPVRNIPSRAGSIRSIALLRGVAVLLVLWDHVIAGWTTNHGRSWIPLDTVRDWTSAPLGIIQDFGFLGVSIFFLLSGYIISEVAVRESRLQFAVKRFLRIYPALIASVALIVALDLLRPSLGLGQQRFGLTQSLWAMTLGNYIRGTTEPVNGVAWSLLIEVLFYFLVLCCMSQLKRKPLVAIGIEMAVVLVIILSARSFPIDSWGSSWFLLAASVAYIPILILGQAVWLAHSRRVQIRTAVIVGMASWILFVLGMRRIHTQFLLPANSYGVSIALALGIFVAAVFNEEKLRLPSWVASLSVISYSVYLIHGPVTSIVMDWLGPHLPFTVHLVVAVVVLFGCSTAMWRLVEVPSQAAARYLLVSRERRLLRDSSSSL